MQRLLTLVIVLFYLPLLSQSDTASVMYYNVLNFPGSTSQRVNNFRTINQYLKPDIILITEIVTDAGAQLLLSQGLNVYGETKYQKANYIDGFDTDDMLFFNSEKFTLYSHDTIETDLRAIGEYVLYYNIQPPYNIQDTVFLYLYVAHLKAGNTSPDEQQRVFEVMKYKQYVNAKPNIENMFFGGDLNLYTASDDSYNDLIVNGNYPMNDVLPSGNWHDNAAYSGIHTQSTRTAQFGGGATGGCDDRFDFMLFTNDILSGSNNVTYLANTYEAVGNDGNHLNKAINDTPINTSVPDSVLQAIYNMSDHLPIISQFLIQPDIVQQSYELSLKVLLEGPFTTTEMTTGINSILPLTSPYGNSPWNSNGGESVLSIPNPNITDWILVELRDAANPGSALPGTVINQQAAFLFNDGTIKGLDGISNLQFNHVVNQQLFVVLYHRNHLSVMSASGLNHTGNLYSFDFTDSPVKTYGGNNASKQLSASQWGMISGDCNASGQVNISDKELRWNNEAGKSGYLSSDTNLDGEADNTDKNGLIILNYSSSSAVPQ